MYSIPLTKSSRKIVEKRRCSPRAGEVIAPNFIKPLAKKAKNDGARKVLPNEACSSVPGGICSSYLP